MNIYVAAPAAIFVLQAVLSSAIAARPQAVTQAATSHTLLISLFTVLQTVSRVCGGWIFFSGVRRPVTQSESRCCHISPVLSVCLFASLVSCRAAVMTANKASAPFVIPRSFSYSIGGQSKFRRAESRNVSPSHSSTLVKQAFL